MFVRPQGLHLEIVSVVDDHLDHVTNVVGAVRLRWHDIEELVAATRGLIGRNEVRRVLLVVGRQERQQVADLVEAAGLVVDQEGSHPGAGGVCHGSSEFLSRGRLAGHGFHHIGTGDEQVGLVLDTEHEVGERRGVGGAAGAGPEDHRDLRDDARQAHVPREDAAETRQCCDALLDTGASAVVEPDDRRAGRGSEVHQRVDLRGEHFTE